MDVQPASSRLCFDYVKTTLYGLTAALALISTAEAKIVQELTEQLPQANSSTIKLAAQSTTTYSSERKAPVFKEVGRGEMQWWWFSLYRARLLTLDGDYSSGEYPVMLDIEYYQDIPSDRLVEATLDQWQHIGVSEQDQQQWLSAISAVWPDVTEGDSLSLKVISPDSSQFYFNGEPLAEPLPKGFSNDFLAIWLSEQTSRPELRKQLLGELACDC
ncbi:MULTISPECIES: chalcone isomerase family protein [Shewanella]|uniref:Chalcone isomerase family protein n=1 Tax=Shewanella fidelis TaxID=173509 RepID=A0AAW8NNZ6_9GAMM|nr:MULTISPECIES: chalcone isomerase family protein [Shewanella]MDR8524882.1 chalcone isomerase family protein [Shewanella fidelis]MDW4810953.1 chalcone isomerase family protein [Shewanella fidelis]MDW4815268.1 chalcone isomerase family protein [Shewanella fidelis]MDW4819358.1 chalcone isomerase family protein [Shewanella fidelis]MDW4822964.1 chalcone isomerase family protein [Shewanella fidelis]